MRMPLLLCALLSLPGAALAQTPPTFTPGAAPEPMPHAVITAFQARYLGVDLATGQATQGKEHGKLSPVAFYEALERPDLVAAYRGAEHTKTALYVAGGAVGVAGLVAGVAELLTRPDLSSARCQDLRTFNTDCGPTDTRHGNLGAGFIAGGVALGASLALVGLRIDPAPVTPVEAKALADAHNRALWQRLRQGEGHALRLAPVLEAHGGGVLLAGRF